ncbi:MAG: hypothetical protein EAZ35_02340 [Sphingobacteriia bacterium]|nr:MAG: hypothetical protein EAZ35_02340 [Sphingobacteriia bacterium]
MAYTPENKYKRILEVQKYFKECYTPGMTIEWIYKNKIKEKYHISRRAFMNYINVPAERLLKELKNESAKNKAAFKQISMDFDNGVATESNTANTHSGL